MKRLIYMIFAVAMMAAASCSEKWETSIDLGVNTTRVNLDDIYEGEFLFTVFSSQAWTVSVTQGEGWLVPVTSFGEGSVDLGFTYSGNMQENARIGKFLLTAESGKEIFVSVVQSGTEQKASAVDDIELL